MLSSTFKNTILKRSQATFTKPVTVSLIEGDGIGVEITASVKKIFAKAGVPIKWEDCDVGPVIKNNNTAIPDDAVANIKKNKVALKGPLATPIGKGHRSLNLTLRQTFGLYANLRPALSIQGYDFLYKDIDFVVIRENTEGEYFGVEHEVNADNVVSIKLITKDACERVIKFAVDQAVKTNRKKVVVVHQSTVQPKTDGLFKEVGESLVNYNKDIEFEFELLESYIYRSVKDPKIYHDAVVVAPNLYGDIITDLNSGLAVGSLGMTPSANIGTEVSIFEAVHGSAPDIAGKDLANPSAMLLAGCMLLEHVGLGEYSDKIKKAALATIAEGIKTGDLKGKSTNSQYTDAICAKL